MKKVAEELRYDGATQEQVHEMLADPTFREKVLDHQHVLRHTVQVTGDSKGMTVVIDQVQSSESLPSFARRVVGDEIHIVQTEDWTGPTKGNVHVAIPGKPGEMVGTSMLTEDPEGTTQTVNLSVKVNIPLVGGKLEGLIAGLLSKALRAEHTVGVDWLAGNR